MEFLTHWFAQSNFKFDYPNEEICYLPQWQTHNRVETFYLMYRLFHFCYFWTIMWISYSRWRDIPFKTKFWAIAFYQYWIYIMNYAGSLASLISVVMKFVNPINSKDRPIWYRFHWMLYSACIDSQFGVSFGFIAFLYWYRTIPTVYKTRLASNQIHFWSFLLVLMDLLITSFPLKIYDIWPSVLISFMYGVFSYLYRLIRHKEKRGVYYLSEVLHLGHSLEAVLLAFCIEIILVILARLIGVGIFKLRTRVYRKYYVKRTSADKISRFVL